MTQKISIPTTHYNLKRLLKDLFQDVKLWTKSGQNVYWAKLGSQCEDDSMISLLERAVQLEGDVIECGVFRGGSLVKLAHTLRKHAPDKMLFGLDSFEGFPQDTVGEFDLGPGRKLDRVKRKFQFCSDTPHRLARFFEMYDVQARLIPGFFQDTLSEVKDRKFCFIHLDVDLYQSYIDCLEALYDQLVPGGIIVFDEAEAGAWPGANKAIAEFFADKSETVEKCVDRNVPSWYICKTGAPVLA